MIRFSLSNYKAVLSMAAANPPVNRTDFKIAILCALPLEAEAVLPLFEVVYSGDQYRNLTKASEDANAYTLGRIGEYNIILVHMPNAGKQAAASVAVHLKRSYPGIELSFLLGVCGGVPFAQDMDRPGARKDIFLGDIVVSHGVVQYDLGARLPKGFVRKDTLTSNLGRPSQEIRSIIAMMKASHRRLMPRLLIHLANIQEAQGILYPGSQKDILFRSVYEHSPTNCQCFFDVSKIEDTVISRRRTPDIRTPCPNLHFGFVASGDMVIKSATYRDQVSENECVIGFEMELAGIWDNLPCILIKGVADYADSHKNKEWQRFAAASSAACLRSLLDFTPISLAPLESGPSRGKQIRV
jgi:nucleoside phosphorylase